jgi:hypothetical protein
MQAVAHVTTAAWTGAPSRRARNVYEVLEVFANRDGWCHPSVKRIAMLARYSVRSVQYALRELEQAGWIQVEYRKGPKGGYLTSVYRVLRDRVIHAIKEAQARLHWPEKWSWPRRGSPPGAKGVPEPDTTTNLIKALTTIFTQKRERTFDKRPHLSEHAQRNILACREYLFGKRES